MKQRKAVAVAAAAAPVSAAGETSDKRTKKNKNTPNHFVPLPLVCIIFLCSGTLWTLALRDLFRTGQVIMGSMDAAMLQFTQSTQWFDDSKGWKSTQGGLSAILPVTTDSNNMGGFFVRKLAGAAALTVHSQKLVPVLFQQDHVDWGQGHFDTLLVTAILGNIAIALVYLFYQKELANAGAHGLALVTIFISLVEALAMALFMIHRIFSFKKNVTSSSVVITLPPGKNPSSLVSNIIARTVGIVTLLITVISGRDLFFPGYDMGFPPSDDLYLEWTGAFIHSPPMGSPEESDYGLEAPFHIGDRFISQVGATYILITCFQKFVSALWIRYGIDGSGPIRTSLFWRIQCLGDGLMLMVFRAFASAAKSASFDVRWHLMCLGYEACILTLYAYF